MDSALSLAAIIFGYGYVAVGIYVLYLLSVAKVKRTVRKAITLQWVAVVLEFLVVVIHLITRDEMIYVNILTLGLAFGVSGMLYASLAAKPEHTEAELKAKREWEAVERAHNEIVDELHSMYRVNDKL